MEAKKFIYIVQVTRQLSIDIINEFAKHNLPITVLTGSIEQQHSGLHRQVKVKRFNRYINTSFSGRILSGLWFHFRCFLYVLFSGRKQELILVSTPPFLPFLGIFFFRLRKQKYHLLIWDLYPDVLLRMNKIKSESAINKFWSRRNASLFKNSSSLITLGHQMAESLASYTDKKAHIIPPWANTSYLKPLTPEENLFLKTHGLHDKFIVMYAGNLGITHPVEIILKTAEQLKSDDRFRFVIIGEGEKKNKLQRMKEEAQLHNVLLLPYQSPEMFPHALAAAQVSVITLSSHAADVSVPSKTFSALAVGSALLVIGPEDSGLGEILKHFPCGEIFSENEISSVTGFLQGLVSDGKRLKEYQIQSLRAAASFTPANATRYYQVICNAR